MPKIKNQKAKKMNIDVGKAITELLFEHDTVIVPGLGGFTTTPESATVDYVQGVVTPPTKKMDFNPNLVINDGILVGHIQKRNVVTAQQAKEAVEGYVEELQAALARREIIEIPEVGRIYRDYEQQLKFMPEGTNFEANAFGLPEVKFTPVSRVKEAPDTAEAKPKIGKVAAATQVAAAAHEKSAAKSNKKVATSGWLNKMLPVLIILAAILLAFSLFMILRDGGDEAVAGVDKERINVKPAPSNDGGETEDKTAGLTDENESSGSDEGTEKSSSSDASQNDETTTSPTPPPTEKKVPPVKTEVEPAGKFIVIHSFGVEANAKKFERKLKRDGYDARSTKHGGLNRVGVRVGDMTSSEIDAMIAKLGRKYKSTPKLVDY